MVQIENKEELKKSNDPKLAADYKDVNENNEKLNITIEESKKVSQSAAQGNQEAQDKESTKVKDIAGNDTHDGTARTGFGSNTQEEQYNKTETKKTINVGKGKQ